MKLSIIIPVFNEEKSIITVLKKLEKVTIPSVSKEILIVDDGSSDKTALSVEKYLNQKKDKSIHFFQHQKNLGKGAAVITGIKKATGDYILIQDADTEYDPVYISSLVKPVLEKKAEVVFGTRLNRLPNFSKEEGHPLFVMHYLGNRFLSLSTSVLYGQWITDMETCYKLFPKKIVNTITLKARGFAFEPEITAKILKKGFRIQEVPITTTPRGYEEGKKLNALKEGPVALWTLLKYRFVD